MNFLAGQVRCIFLRSTLTFTLKELMIYTYPDDGDFI